MPVSPADWQAQFIAWACLLCAPLAQACAVYTHRTTGRKLDAAALIIAGLFVAVFGWEYGRVTLGWWPAAAESAALRPSLVVLVLTVVALFVTFTVNSKRIADYLVLQNQFIANVSHELRTPLNVIMGYAAPELADARHFPTIYRSAERMAFLVNNVLGVARLEEGGALEKTAVDLAAVAGESVAGLHIQAQRSGVSLRARLNSAVVYGSEPALVLLVNNLLHNAIKFNTRGGGVEIRTFTADDGGVLQVQDTGIGISADDFRRLFRRFEQLDGSDKRSFTGVGIGLYFVDLLVQAHNGRIRVESVVGEGSLFEVWLPGVRDDG